MPPALQQSNASVNELYKIFEGQYNENNTETTRTAAINFLTALSGKGEEYQNLIKEKVLTPQGISNIADAFDPDSWFLASDIKEVIDDIKGDAEDIEESNNFTVNEAATWKALNDKSTPAGSGNFTINAKESINDINIYPQFNDDFIVDTGKHSITFDSSQPDLISVASNGDLVINGSREVQNMGVTIDIKVDGKVVSSKTIMLTVNKALTAESAVKKSGILSGFDDGCTRVFGATTVSERSRAQGQSLNKLYQENAIIELYNENNSGDVGSDYEDCIKPRFEKLVTGIYNALTSSVSNTTLLKRAADYVYEDWLSTIGHSSGRLEDYSSLLQTDENYEGDAHMRYLTRKMQGDDKLCKKGIVTAQDKNGRDHWVVAVSVKALVDAIIAKYFELGGT